MQYQDLLLNVVRSFRYFTWNCGIYVQQRMIHRRSTTTALGCSILWF